GIAGSLAAAPGTDASGADSPLGAALDARAANCRPRHLPWEAGCNWAHCSRRNAAYHSLVTNEPCLPIMAAPESAGQSASDLMSSDASIDAYFERINFAGSIAPTLSTLEQLHVLHPAAIPFENLN